MLHLHYIQQNVSLKSNLKTETNKKETVKQELQRLYILMKVRLHN